MPRTARSKSESGIYHVMLRGIDRQTIFQDEEDYQEYLHCLSACQPVSNFTLHAYCLMSNHLHLLIEEGSESLGQIFKRVGTRFVHWYNWKYERTGHLFQDRFKSEPIDDDAYFLSVLRYIYQNPVKAGLCRNTVDYFWSSRRTLGNQPPLVSDEKALALLPLAQLKNFIEEPSSQTFIDYEDQARINDREASELIKKHCHLSNLSDFSALTDKVQEKALWHLHSRHCSIRQLSRLTGVSKGKIERILKT